jgi:hypothetical protein
VLAKVDLSFQGCGEKMTIFWKYQLEKLSKVEWTFTKDLQEKIS